MKNLKNKVQLIGFIGRDPETKKLQSGKSVTKFSLATNETYKDANGEKVTDTQWHNLVCWAGQSTFADQYLSKGDEITIEGKLTHRSYEDKEGITRTFTEIVVNDILVHNFKSKEVAA